MEENFEKISSDENLEEPTDVPFIPIKFNRDLYEEWETIRQSDPDIQQNYAPFGEVEGRTFNRQIAGPAHWTDIWPPDSPYIGEEWNEPSPPDKPLTDDQEIRCFSDLIQNVYFGKSLGRGAFGMVWNVEADYRCGDLFKWERRQFACKVIRHRFEGMEGINLSLNETRILQNLKHENICNLAETLGIPDRKTGFPYAVICMFLELCDGSFRDIYMQSLPPDFPFLTEKYDLPERLNRHWFSQIIRGIDYIHQNKVIHLDVKKENILYKYGFNKSENTYSDRFLSATFKLADFGVARIEDNPVNMRRYQKQDLKQIFDMILEYGVPGPRGGIREESILIIYCKNGFWKDSYPQQWKGLTSDFRNLISLLSDSRPTVPKGLTASQLLTHPWLQNNDDPQTEHFIIRTDYIPFSSININQELYKDWEEQRINPQLHRHYTPFGYAPMSRHRTYDQRNFDWRLRYSPLSGAPNKFDLYQYDNESADEPEMQVEIEDMIQHIIDIIEMIDHVIQNMALEE